MRIGNNFSWVCVSVTVTFGCNFQAVTFELLKLGTSILVYIYILIICRSSLSIKIIGSRSSSNKKLTYFYLPATSVCLYATKTY